MVVEAYLDTNLQAHSEGAAARDVLSVLEYTNTPRAPLEDFLLQSSDALGGALREADVLQSVGLTAHPMGLEERMALSNGQRRVLIIGATEESITCARELLQHGVAVVMVDTFPSSVNRLFPVSEQQKQRYTPDVFHHPLMFTVQAERVSALTEAPRVFHGILLNNHSQSLHEIAQKSEDIPQVFSSAALFAQDKHVEIDANGVVTCDGVQAGAIGLTHNRSLGRILVAGEDPYVIIQAARAAVDLRITHARLRKEQLAVHADDAIGISPSAREPIPTGGWSEVKVGSSTESVVDIVSREQLPSSVKDGVSILHPDGVAAFEKIGFTREFLRAQGITIIDHSEVTDVDRTSEHGVMVSRDWWVTNALNVKQTEKVGALILASTVQVPSAYPDSDMAAVFEMGVDGASRSDRDVAMLMNLILSRHVTLNAYEDAVRSAMGREDVRYGELQPRDLLQKRQEHLVHASYETLAHLFRSYGQNGIAKDTADARIRGKTKKKNNPYYEYMIAIGDEFHRQAKHADSTPNSIGIREIELLVPRFDAPEKRRKRVRLGVRILHDGSIQIETEKNKWEPIENMLTVTREIGRDSSDNPIFQQTSVVDHRRYHINHKESAEARLMNHVLWRIGLFYRVTDTNTKFASVMGLRGSRHANLIDLIGAMYPVHSGSPAGTKGSAYQTPGGGIRLTFNTDGSEHQKSVWINAQGVVYKVGSQDVRIQGERTVINPVNNAEKYLSFMLLPEKLDDVATMHDRAIRELFTTAVRMTFSPLVMDLLKQEGLDHTASYSFEDRFILHRYRSGLTDRFGETKLYYAVDYKHDDGSVSDVGIRVMDSGDIQIRDADTGSWQSVVSSSQLFNYMCERIGVSVSENQYTGFPIREFFRDAVMDVDSALRHRAVMTFARSAGFDQVTAAHLSRNAPIVFGQAGEVYVLMRDGENEEVFERILSDRRMKKLLRRMAAAESLHIDTDRYTAEKKLRTFEQEHGVKISMVLSAIGSFMAVYNGANPGDVVIGSLGAGGLGLLSMYTAVHMQEKFQSKHAVTAARIAYRMGEYLLLSGAEAALGGITGYAATQVFPPDHQVQTFGQAVFGVLPHAFQSAPVQDPSILQSSIDAATALQATSPQMPIDTVTALVDSPVGSLTWDLHAAVSSILGGTGWVNDANGVTQAQVIQHYLMQCAGEAIRNAPDVPVSQLLSDGEIANIRQIIATSSYREYLQAVVNGLYH